MPGGRRVEGPGAVAAPSPPPPRLEPGPSEGPEEPDEDDEDLRDGGPCFVNRGGLPLDEATWERMWRHVAKTHPDGERVALRIRGAPDLPKIPIPSVPTFPPATPVPERLEAVQRYIRELQYNHTGTQFFEIKKSRPLTGLMDLAKEMTKEALPIKCLEAVILGMYPARMRQPLLRPTDAIIQLLELQSGTTGIHLPSSLERPTTQTGIPSKYSLMGRPALIPTPIQGGGDC